MTTFDVQTPVYEPMYEPIINVESLEEHDNPPSDLNVSPNKLQDALNRAELGAVRRRNPEGGVKKNIRQRLSNVISWYVPTTKSVNDDGNLLLNIPEYHDEPNADEAKISLEKSPFHVNRIFSIHQLIKKLPIDVLNTECQSSVEILCATTLNQYLFIAMEKNTILLRVTLNDTTSVEPIPLRIYNQPLYPIHIETGQECLYVSGNFHTTTGNEQVTHNILVKFDIHGAALARTKAYNYPYFGKFCIDVDGSLVISSPQSTEDPTSAKVFKLSAGFEKKSYFIKLGNERAVYRPNGITAHAANNLGWISVGVESASTQGIDSSKNSSRRLLSFSCCKPIDIPVGTETRQWLKVDSWNFEGITPGVIGKVGQRLLIIDADMGNMHFLAWNEEENRPEVQPISKPGVVKFVGITSHGENAYIFTSTDVFHFRFKDAAIA